jgi:hypothetical protein
LTPAAVAGGGTTTGLGQTGFSGIDAASARAGSARKIHLVFMFTDFEHRMVSSEASRLLRL